jgi:hypothetical protein
MMPYPVTAAHKTHERTTGAVIICRNLRGT